MARVPGTFNPKTKIWEGEIPGTHEPGFVEPPLVELAPPPELQEAFARMGVTAFYYFAFGEATVFFSHEKGRWHLSISHPHRHPSWDEIKTVRYRLAGPDTVMAMILPQPERYVNLPEQDHVMQLWQLVDEEAEGW